MTSKTIEQYGSRQAARAVFERIKVMPDLGEVFFSLSQQSPQISRTWISLGRANLSVADLAGMTNTEIKNTIPEMKEEGIAIIDQALEALLSDEAIARRVRRSRDAWSAAHGGLTHPDDKIQGV